MKAAEVADDRVLEMRTVFHDQQGHRSALRNREKDVYDYRNESEAPMTDTACQSSHESDGKGRSILPRDDTPTKLEHRHIHSEGKTWLISISCFVDGGALAEPNL